MIIHDVDPVVLEEMKLDILFEAIFNRDIQMRNWAERMIVVLENLGELVLDAREFLVQTEGGEDLAQRCYDNNSLTNDVCRELVEVIRVRT